MKDQSADHFAAALAALRRGGVVVFPTETFYGLGADALDERAVERVAALKGRNPDSPIAVIIAGREMLPEIVDEVPAVADELIRRFWPGPLTLVLPAKQGLPAALLNRDGKIGARVSSHPAAARLARELGRPLTATSANRTGQAPALTIAEARDAFTAGVDFFFDGGALAGKTGSTVAEIVNNRLKIIREGAIGSKELEKWR